LGGWQLRIGKEIGAGSIPTVMLYDGVPLHVLCDVKDSFSRRYNPAGEVWG
jgi:hypothetical protein